MHHDQTTYAPQSNRYFAAFKRAAAPSGESQRSPLMKEPIEPAVGAVRMDLQIERDVRDELEMEPTIRAAAIDIHVRDGVVALSGVVDGDGERWLVESATRRIAGVKEVLVALKVYTPEVVSNDDDITRDCERVLSRLTPKTDYDIKVIVSKGWVTLLGDVAEGNERRIAETEVGTLLSVFGVNSQVKVRSSIARELARLHRRDAGANIAASFPTRHEPKRSTAPLAIGGDTATWSGTMLSWTQSQAMLYAAWASLTAKRVINHIR